jgi:hypothetical protein
MVGRSEKGHLSATWNSTGQIRNEKSASVAETPYDTDCPGFFTASVLYWILDP